MPVGPYKEFGDCVSAQIRKGKSKESAGAICGEIEKKTRKAAGISSVKYEDANGNLFLKAFLLDASVNINQWGVKQETIDPILHATAIGKPLVLTQNFKHPMPPSMHKVANDSDYGYYDNDDDPYNVVNVEEIVEHWKAYQEDFRVGNIIDITEKNGTYYGIIEVTDPVARDAIKNNDVPWFVSPGIAQLDPYEDASNITKWEFIHLAIVDDPAYTIKKAVISGKCHGEKQTCLLQLRQASVQSSDTPKIGCGFCRTKALARYAEVVKSWHTKHSIVINPTRITKDINEFTNSSIDFSNPQIESELTDKEQNSNQNDNNNNKKPNATSTTDTNNEQEFERVQREQGGDLGEQPQKGNPKVTTETKTTTAEEKVTKEAEVIGARVAGMNECVQIFQQNGVQPDQAMQICKLAAQALMENQNQNQPNNNGGSGQQQGAPRNTGQFGSVAESEKEVAKLELRVAELQNELKTYKKGDKTDAQRIAELEETVTNLNKAYKEKEFEAYLVAEARLEDQDFIQKKIKRFAELNLTLDDVKDIFPSKNIPKGNTGNIKKVAEVQQQQQLSPISRVQLRTASTSTEEDSEAQGVAKTASVLSETFERNNRIISSLTSKGGYN